MNRKQRRAVAKSRANPHRRPPRKPGQIIKPWLHEVHRVFAPIEWMFDELRRGEITELNGEAAFRDIDGSWFTVVPALTGWIDTWSRLNQRHALGIDFAPLQQLADALEYNELMTGDDIEAAYAVIARCREAYRNMDVYEVKDTVKTTEIVIALEDTGAAGKETA